MNAEDRRRTARSKDERVRASRAELQTFVTSGPVIPPRSERSRALWSVGTTVSAGWARRWSMIALSALCMMAGSCSSSPSSSGDGGHGGDVGPPSGGGAGGQSPDGGPLACTGETRANLIKYLTQLPTGEADRMLVGQYISVAHVSRVRSSYEEVVTGLQAATGKSPAVLELRLFDAQPGEFAADWPLEATIELLWDAGNIIYISLEPPNPETGMAWHVRNDPSLSQLPADLASVYTPGTEQNAQYLSNLAQAAEFLQRVRDLGIVVLFEPFNEQPGRWHWYAHHGGDKAARLYRYTHNYFTETAGLDNLVWVWEWHTSNDGRTIEDFYPGNDHVDLVGLSLYGNSPGPQSSAQWAQLVALGKPVAFTEFGPSLSYSAAKASPPYFSWDNRIQMEAFRTYFPEAVFFTRWANVWATANQNFADEFMDDPWLIDLAELKTHRSAHCF